MSDSASFTSGSLFTTDYLVEAIRTENAYTAVDVKHLRGKLEAIAAAFPQSHKTNESQTEDDFIWPVLGALGWTESLRQQNLTVSGRDDVPDGLLFVDAGAKAGANAQIEQWKPAWPSSRVNAGLGRLIGLPGGTKAQRRRRKCCATCVGSMI